MGYWIEDRYYYTRGELEYIADNYSDYLAGNIMGIAYDSAYSSSRCDIGQSKDRLRLDPLSSKVDFDRALNAIGKGSWSGTRFLEGADDHKIWGYRNFGRRQVVIIADILGEYKLEDENRPMSKRIYEGLEYWGFYDVSELRKLAYHSMVRFLNTGVQ